MDRWKLYALLSGAGLAFFAAVMLGVWVGQWLDGALHGGGLWTMLMLAVGMAGAVLNLVRVLNRIANERKS